MQPQKTLVLAVAVALVACLMFYFPTRNKADTLVGVTYTGGMKSSLTDIQDNLDQIEARGFKLVRTVFSLDTPIKYPNSPGDSTDDNYDRVLMFLAHARNLGLQTYVSVIIPVGWLECSVLTYEPALASFAQNFSGKIDYWQILNEVDALKRGDGNAYMATETVNIIKRLSAVIRQANPQAKTVVTLTQLYAARPDLLMKLRELASSIDYVGLDVYEQGSSFTPNQINELSLASGKPVIIAETGCSSPNPSEREQFARSQVTAFKNQAIQMVVLFDWVDSIYSLKTTGLTV